LNISKIQIPKDRVISNKFKRQTVKINISRGYFDSESLTDRPCRLVRRE
jgi:hypothetical protein